jgi:hypothetical protein
MISKTEIKDEQSFSTEISMNYDLEMTVRLEFLFVRV